MKKVFRTIVVLAVAAVAMSACKKEMQEAPVATGIKVDFVAQSLDTKTEFGTASGSTIPVLWQAGDKVTVMVNPKTTKNGASTEVTPSSDFKKATFEGTIPDGLEAPYNFYVLSPSSQWVSAGTNGTYGEYIQFTIPTVQNPVSGNIDPEAQVVLARSEEYPDAPTSSIPLSFKHMAAYGVLSLANLNTAGKTIENITLEFGSLGIAGRYIYKTAENEVIINNPSSSIILNTSETENIHFAIGPADISGITMKVSVGVSDGSYEQEVTVPSGKEFKTGVISHFTVDMSGASFVKAKSYALVTDLSTLSAGDKLIIATVKEDFNVDNVKGKAAMSTTQNTHNRQAVQITEFMQEGKIYNPSSLVDVFTLEASSINGTWLLKSSNDTYLGRNDASGRSGSNDLHEYTDLSATETLNCCSWTISSEDSQTSAVTLKSNATVTDRVYIRANISGTTYIFSCYKSGQNPVCLYREEVSDTPEPEKELTVERVWGLYPADYPAGIGIAEGNRDRAAAMDEENVYVVEANVTNYGIKAVSIADPTKVKNVNVTGVDGGTFKTACVRTIYSTTLKKHVLLACSLVTGSGEAFKIYSWENGIDNAPTVQLTWNVGNNRRFGDFFTVTGTWEDGHIWLRNNQPDMDHDCNLTAQFPIKNGVVTQQWPNAFRNGYGGSKGAGSIYFYQHGTAPCVLITDAIGMFFNINDTAGEEWGNGDDVSAWKNIFGITPFEFNGEKYIAYLKMYNLARGWLTIIKDVNGTASGFKDTLIKGKEAENIVFQGAVQLNSDTPSTDTTGTGQYSNFTSGSCSVIEKEDCVLIMGHQQNVGLALFKMYMK